MPDEIDFSGIESLINFQATAELNADQYMALLIAMGQWCEAYKDDEDPKRRGMIVALRSIEFKRTR